MQYSFVIGSSLATSAPFKVNFDLIVKNIEELNNLAGEGEHVIAHTSKGARLKVDPLQISVLISSSRF